MSPVITVPGRVVLRVNGQVIASVRVAQHDVVEFEIRDAHGVSVEPQPTALLARFGALICEAEDEILAAWDAWSAGPKLSPYEDIEIVPDFPAGGCVLRVTYDAAGERWEDPKRIVWALAPVLKKYGIAAVVVERPQIERVEVPT